MPLRFAVLAALLALLAACAPQPGGIVSTPERASRETAWGFENSDIPLDPAYRFGRLANGMRYVIRHNATPAGTGLVRMEVAAGSLDEAEGEQGYAHFIEHMAFNGSTRVPEGEMVRLLERDGLAFGADTNASTSFERTTYRLDLPRNDPALLDTALMLMRETASELTVAPEAVNRERGVVLAEMRDRNTWQFRETVEGNRFFYPQARFTQRFPIGMAETVDAATADTLKAFYKREYVPAHTTLVVIGDFDVTAVEAAILARFGDWAGAPAEPQPDAGPIAPRDRNRIDIYIDPAMAERVTVMRSGPWIEQTDTAAIREHNLLRNIGYDIVNRRLQRLSRQQDAPFRGAGFGTGDVFETARSTRLIVDTVERKWRRGLIAVAREYRRALTYGFTAEEVAEQVANVRTAVEDSAAAAETRGNDDLVGAVFALLHERLVPSDPVAQLERFNAVAPRITPERVLEAMRAEAVPLEDPLMRLRSRFAPAGGAEAIRAAWREAMKASVSAESSTDLAGFAYTDFGPAGVVVSDRREPRLAIREVRFANGVMLNLKQTALEKDRVHIAVSIDGGDMLDTPKNPLATEMMPYLDEGGLGRHSADELQTILAGRKVSASFGTGESSFDASAVTTPRDLEVELQLLAALTTDPGYRREGEIQYRHQMNNYFNRLRATPNSSLRADLGGILSNDDPRFTLQQVDAYRALTFARLRQDVSDRLAHGAIEIGLVGDIAEDQAIALVAATFGALPAREPAFRAYENQPPRLFTADRTPRVLRHAGAKDQALLRLTWPTRDDGDPLESLELELLERVVRIELSDTLREALGKAYSPAAASSLSREWKGYGTFGIAASLDVRDVPAARAAILRTVSDLRSAPVTPDILQRARQPMVEGFLNGLKSNEGWLSLVDQAQTEPDRIDRYLTGKDRLLALTAEDVRIMAARYLEPAQVLEVLVLPDGVEVPPEAAPPAAGMEP
ncbi:M16 family metallopeptidase [Novosphingobium album (ex Liu et al. 2023)]|uniref:Insulinase family protein n=1 Tax=Novosphingobium album (ex Liu et al. 2023) TaxID=3031130 RepID=A0ABT5WTM3_9SPHN|nr:M16 family metallopeptidase [Novosphingobium album (ex Liu et al. 2023)]MDE8653233.1 insulinase family protein [Novosphingobium album (ex Liu et al. 2023)]